MQFLVPHKMNFGDNSNIINAPVVTSEPTEEVFIKNNNHNNNNNNNNNKLLATSSQEENFNENKKKNKDVIPRQRQGSPLSSLNEKKASPTVASIRSNSSQKGLKRSAERFLDDTSPSYTPHSYDTGGNNNVSNGDSIRSIEGDIRRQRLRRRTTIVSPVTLEFHSSNSNSSSHMITPPSSNMVGNNEVAPLDNQHQTPTYAGQQNFEAEDGILTSPVIMNNSNDADNEMKEDDDSNSDHVEEDMSAEDAEAASLRLAMQLQEQESMMVYQQMQQMQAAMAQSAAEARANGEGDGEEEDSDLMYALELARQEQIMGEQQQVEQGEEGESFDSEDMDYEQLLALGERIGDVAQDRWRLSAPEKIAALPTTKVTKEYIEKAEGNDGMCQVCQCDYEEGEEMKILPCKHHFHSECIDRWLQDHPTCCICKKSIIADEEDDNVKQSADNTISSTSDSSHNSSSTANTNTHNLTPEGTTINNNTRLHRTPSS